MSKELFSIESWILQNATDDSHDISDYVQVNDVVIVLPCLKRTRLVVKWRHLVVTFSVEELFSIAQIKSFDFDAVSKPSLS